MIVHTSSLVTFRLISSG